MVSSSPLVAEEVLKIYKMCDGLRPLNGQSGCIEVKHYDISEVEASSPVPPNPPSRNENFKLVYGDYTIDGTSLGLEALNLMGLFGYYTWLWLTSYKKKKTEAKEQKMEELMSRVQASLRKDIHRDVAALLDVLGGERPVVRQVASRADEQGSEDHEDSIDEDQLYRKNSKKPIDKESTGKSA